MPFSISSSAKYPNTPTNGTGKGHGDPTPGKGDGGPAPASDDWPPPGVDPYISENFRAIDKDNPRYLTITELQAALKNGGDWLPFEIDTVKLMMSIFDTNRDGKIDIIEFDGLWKYIKSWEAVFHHFDKSNNNSIDGNELTEALKQFGYHLSPRLQDLLKRKYDVPWSSKGAAPGGDPIAASGITFDRFIRACVVVKHVKESFDALDRDPIGRAKITYEQLLELVFKLP